jgi:hypothetical protein
MKMNKKSFGLLAVVAAVPFSGGIASAAPVAPAAAPAAKVKIALPVVAGAQSLSKAEKSGVKGEGLLSLNVLEGSNLLNNLNILNIGSFNSFKWTK